MSADINCHLQSNSIGNKKIKWLAGKWDGQFTLMQFVPDVFSHAEDGYNGVQWACELYTEFIGKKKHNSIANPFS